MTKETTNETLASICDRDGHLSELAIDRYLAGEFQDDLLAAVEQHLEEDEVSAQRLAEIKAFDADFSIAPPSFAPPEPSVPAGSETKVVSLEQARKDRAALLPIVGIFAAAAALFLVFNLQNSMHSTRAGDPVGDGADTIRVKGSALSLEVFQKSDKEVRNLQPGDTIHPGDRIGFRVTTKRDGFLFIIGIDQSNEVYPCHPQQKGAPAQFVRAATAAQPLQSAVEMDALLGSERFVALLCESEISYTEASQRALGIAQAHAKPAGRSAGCVYEQMQVTKKAKR